MIRAASSRALVAAVVVASVTGCKAKVPADAPEACLAAIQCYFGTDADHQLGRVGTIQGLGNPTHDPHQVDPFVDTYGKNGTCWADRTDTALLHSCEDRCRALLWTDCSLSYHAPAPGPFCVDTQISDDPRIDAGTPVLPCQFPMECRRDVSGGATACPDPLDSCTAPTPDAGQLDTFGCCDIGQGFPEDGGCAYQHVEDDDHRQPPGNPAGELGGGP